MTAIYRLKVTLRHVEPPVWRRLEVPATLTLQKLHGVFQTAMGWADRHLYEFRATDAAYGIPDEDTPPDLRDARKAKLKDVAREGGHLEYAYDFGDGWEHDVVVEGVTKADPATQYPICVGGERACPPDDCGGPYGYLELLEALKDPKHERHDEMREWVGGFFDPEGFDANAVNRLLWGPWGNR